MRQVGRFWSATLLLLLAGCAALPPKGTLLPPEEEVNARQLFSRFSARSVPEGVDADIALSWQVYGESGRTAGTLMASHPANLRVSLLDPLGRPWAMLASDGSTFTLVDTQAGIAYDGMVGSETWQEYFPVPVTGGQLLGLLSGQPALDHWQLTTVRGGETGYWYTLSMADEQLYLLLDATTARLEQALLATGEEVRVEIRYTGRVEVEGTAWPERVTVRGEAFPGTYGVEFKKIYTVSPLPPERFTLRVPAHYQRQQLD
jgi:hypothetical protein